MTLEEIHAHLKGIVGKRTWGVSLGYGSFLTLEFGDPIPTPGGHPHGEWHVWIYGAGWRIERDGRFLAASEDDRPVLRESVRILDGKTLISVEIGQSQVDGKFCFEGGLTLKTFALYSSDFTHWMLYMPGKKILTVGPGQKTEIGPSDVPRAR